MSDLVERLQGLAGELANNSDYAAKHQSTLDSIDAMAKAADRIEALENPWRPVFERLPIPGSYVLVFSEIAGYELGVFTVSKEWFHCEDGELSHWMELPDPPDVASKPR